MPPVTNFRVIEEGLFSLKVAWTPPLGKLEGYKIYIPRGEFSFLGVCFKRSSESRGQEKCLFIQGILHHNAPGITLEGGQVSFFQTLWFLWDGRREFFEGPSLAGQGGDDAVDALYSVAPSYPDLPWMFFILKYPFSLCFAANRPGMTYEQVLRGDVSSHVLDNLQEDREYSVSIYAVYPQGPSQPVAAVGRTCKRFDSLAAPLPWALLSNPLLLISTL